MRSQAEQARVTLEGTVARVVYRDAEKGFSVLRLEVDGRREPVTIKGSFPELHEGEPLRVEGLWVDDARFGRQVKVERAERAQPTGARSVERFLASGLVKGIGPKLAQRIVEALGAGALDLIEQDPKVLAKVKGLGAKKRASVAEAIVSQKKARLAEGFLRGLGLGPGLTARVLARYGEQARPIVERDPYRLAREVEGVGFAPADRLARASGIARDAPERARAGIVHALTEASEHGDTGLPLDELFARAARVLGLAPNIATPLLERALETARVEEEVHLDSCPGEERVDAAFLPGLLAAETGSARALAELSRLTKRSVPPIDVPRALEWIERGGAGGKVTPSRGQAEAVRAALESPLSVITGGPGVGKTTVVRAIVAVLKAKRARVALAAPTGRAAKRLEEATGTPASTLHRLLEWDPRRARFTRDGENPIEADVLIIDECSMVDVRLFHAALRALPRGASLVMVGDRDQLPSVGPGDVLAHVIESGVARVVRLDEVFRQAAESRIVKNAHRVLRGDVPELGPPGAGERDDFFYTERDDAASTRDAIVRLVTERIPAKFGLDPRNDVMVLSPMRKGACGAKALNEALQKALNPSAAKPGELAAGDRVMQLKNDYDKEVWNGDVGRVLEVKADGNVRVAFDSGAREVSYTAAQSHSLALAYCATVHKAQGGEFPAVVIPVLTEHYVLLARSLLYTAITRGKRLVVLAGQRRAVEIAVENDGGRRRRSWLSGRVRELVSPG